MDYSLYTFREMDAVERIQHMAFNTNLFRDEFWRMRAVESIREAGVKAIDERVARGNLPGIVGCYWADWMRFGFPKITEIMQKQRNHYFKRYVDEGWACAVWSMHVQSWLNSTCTAGVVIRGVWIPPDGNIYNFKNS